MLTRREIVAGGALTVLFTPQPCLCSAGVSQARHSRGCQLADEDLATVYPAGTDTRVFRTGNEPMIPKSGDADFDYALAQTLSKISDRFNVLPGFAYYDDF